ncbi:hypothetical protein CBR_g40405 [Chara braunii]|uniref:DNA helicase n=1 Tax=Chara braunii TaxID=69332 RepID=A0A388LTV8_CHABU|nr:hypothetical protein CBR_g40405 [Chara braunii]|eukprot:GBG85673.1 hypothetical protein CBR_g40405 [Chara braunii]
METNYEARYTLRRTFIDFLEQDLGHGTYSAKINAMLTTKNPRLIVDLGDLRTFNQDLARRFVRSPGEYLPAFDAALEETARSINAKAAYGLDLHVGFEGQFGFHRVSPRELLSPFLSTLVCVEGIITKCSLVRPKVAKSVHHCPATGKFIEQEYRDVTSFSGLPTGAVYPTKDDNGNVLVTEFGLSKYRDHQTLAIQEMPECSPAGQLPRSVDVIVEDDLVDRCKPGDRVAIVGVYKAIASKSQGSTAGVFRTVVVANNVMQFNKSVNAPSFTQEDLVNIRKIAERQDLFDLLAESVAPSIYGHLFIKKAILLQLLGGVEKNLKNGTHIRGDVNIMMVGDPSVAKSQVLRAVMNLAPLSISTTGRGSSGVGLTAAVTTDSETGERRLEAGAMVLADRGVVCIDEFDKMSDLDRVSIHEVMEQQTVTIAKAGIHASLNARCSVVAAANPIYGNYDHTLSPTKNIGLPDSLLSRFDLLFIVLDQMNPDIDRAISNHVLRMHQYRAPGEDPGLPPAAGTTREADEEEDESHTLVFVKYNRLLHGEKRTRFGKRDPLTIKFLKKYIHYAKDRYQPRLTDEASELIAQEYSQMRSQSRDERRQGGGALPITARTLETIIRLSTAHAKMRLSNTVTAGDAKSALAVMRFALYHTELTDMDEKDKKENGRGKKRPAADRPDDHDGDDDGDSSDDDDGGEWRRTGRGAPAPKQRRRGDMSTPRQGGTTRTTRSTKAAEESADAQGEKQPGSQSAGVRDATQEMPMDVDEDAAEENEPGLIRRRRQSTAGEGASAGPSSARDSAGAEGDQPMEVDRDIDPKREEKFNNLLARMFISNRLDETTIEELEQNVNKDNSEPFTRRELNALLMYHGQQSEERDSVKDLVRLLKKERENIKKEEKRLKKEERRRREQQENDERLAKIVDLQFSKRWGGAMEHMGVDGSPEHKRRHRRYRKASRREKHHRKTKIVLSDTDEEVSEISQRTRALHLTDNRKRVSTTTEEEDALSQSSPNIAPLKMHRARELPPKSSRMKSAKKMKTTLQPATMKKLREKNEPMVELPPKSSQMKSAKKMETTLQPVTRKKLREKNEPTVKGAL